MALNNLRGKWEWCNLLRTNLHDLPFTLELFCVTAVEMKLKKKNNMQANKQSYSLATQVQVPVQCTVSGQKFGIRLFHDVASKKFKKLRLFQYLNSFSRVIYLK